jgi:hypothetical protein
VAFYAFSLCLNQFFRFAFEGQQAPLLPQTPVFQRFHMLILLALPPFPYSLQ